MTLDGRRYLVSGAAGGIGAAVARKLAGAGARVALTDRDSDALERLRAELPGGVACVGDLGLRGDATRVVQEVLRALGGLDGLVHCAAIGTQVDLLDCPHERWRQIHAVNLDATFELCQAVARVLARQGQGAIAVLASGAGIRPNAGNVPYGASKAGVIALARSAAIDLAPRGVRMNVLVPGPTETPLMRQIAGAVVPLLERRTMLGRLGRPEEIASAAAFLVSDEARYITGSVLLADGGFSNAGTDFRVTG